MPHIFVENLVKTFRIAERKPGMWAPCRASSTAATAP